MLKKIILVLLTASFAIYFCYNYLDLIVANYIHYNILPYYPWLNNLGFALSIFGYGILYLSGTFIAYLISFSKYKINPISQKIKIILYSLICASIITDIIKITVRRLRPSYYFSHHTYGIFQGMQLSFPSGHATIATAFYYLMSRFVPKYKIIWYALILVTCLARLFHQKHFLGDIIGGVTIGYIVSYYFYERSRQAQAKSN